MKIIEAMKTVKMNLEKIKDLQQKVMMHSANLHIETPVYPNQMDVVRGWLQACEDLTQENVRLLVAIQRTNLATNVTIDLGGKQVTKCLAEWVWRRRAYAKIDLETWQKPTDRGLKEGTQATTTGTIELKIMRFYDPAVRDAKQAMYREEPSRIDMALEIVNATTDLLEK